MKNGISYKLLFFLSCTFLYFTVIPVRSHASYRIVDAEEAGLVIGGNGGGNIFKGGSSSAPSAPSDPTSINITLNNVPYIYQYTRNLLIDLIRILGVNIIAE